MCRDITLMLAVVLINDDFHIIIILFLFFNKLVTPSVCTCRQLLVHACVTHFAGLAQLDLVGDGDAIIKGHLVGTLPLLFNLGLLRDGEDSRGLATPLAEPIKECRLAETLVHLAAAFCFNALH